MSQPLSITFLELDGERPRIIEGQMLVVTDEHGLATAWGTADETLQCGDWDPGISGAQYDSAKRRYLVPKNCEFRFHVSKVRMMS